LVIVGVDGIEPFQARLTFAIGRHALVDLSRRCARPRYNSRRAAGVSRAVRAEGLARASWRADGCGAEADHKLAELRGLYLPYARQLSRLLLMPLAPALPPPKTRYNWETSAWAKTARDDAH
jgi:hypothetical protein